MFHDLIESAVIVADLAATTKIETLDEMLGSAVAAKLLRESQLAAVRGRLLEREKIGSTGIGNGVAVPHVKLDGFEGPVGLVVGRSTPGLDYDAVDGRPVYTLFLVVGPADAAEDHLQLLRWISGLARDADFRRFVRASSDEAEIRDLLREMAPGSRSGP